MASEDEQKPVTTDSPVEETKAVEQPAEPKLAPHQPSNQAEIDSRSIYVGNVDYSTVPNDLKDFFNDCGVVNRITILYDKITGRPKGYAYVEFETADSVSEAVKLSGTEFKGRELNIVAKRTNYPGMNRGRGGRGGYRGRGGFRGRGGARGRGGRGGSSSTRRTSDDVENENPSAETGATDATTDAPAPASAAPSEPVVESTPAAVNQSE